MLTNITLSSLSLFHNVLFHNVTNYTDPLSSCIQVNTYQHHEYHVHFGLQMCDIREVGVYIDSKLDIKEFVMISDANEE